MKVELPLLCALDGLLDLCVVVGVEHLPEVHVVGLGEVRLQVHQHVTHKQDFIQGVKFRVVQVVALEVILAVVVLIVLVVLIVADQVDPVLLVLDDVPGGLGVGFDLCLLLLLVVLLADNDRFL